MNKINCAINNPLTREIYRRDVNYFVYHVEGISGKPYQLTIKWLPACTNLRPRRKVFNIKTDLYTFDHKEQPHPSNFSKALTYLHKAAIKKAAMQKGKTVSFCKDFQSARRLLNFGGDLIRITNLKNGVLWGVIK